jgi:hypothetical protein
MYHGARAHWGRLRRLMMYAPMPEEYSKHQR